MKRMYILAPLAAFLITSRVYGAEQMPSYAAAVQSPKTEVDHLNGKLGAQRKELTVRKKELATKVATFEKLKREIPADALKVRELIDSLAELGKQKLATQVITAQHEIQELCALTQTTETFENVDAAKVLADDAKTTTSTNDPKSSAAAGFSLWALFGYKD